MAYKDKTPEQKLNLNILHDGLVGMYGNKRTDQHFNMDIYQGNDFGEVPLEFHNALAEHERDCGTSACSVGHGPIFGIKGNKCDTWDDYTLESFGVDETSTEWKFLFTYRWTNDIQEAIARLRMYINGFDPAAEDWDFDSRYSV